MLYVEDVDARFSRAVAAGAKVEAARRPVLRRPLRHVKDPFGHQWTIATHKEEVSEAEAQRPDGSRVRQVFRKITVVMESMKLHRGRLIDHVHLIARDLAASRRFYDAALGAVGRKVEGKGEGSSGRTSCS